MIFASVVCVRKERLSSPPVSLPPSPPRLLATMRHGEFLLPTLHGFLLTAVIADCRRCGRTRYGRPKRRLLQFSQREL